MPKKLALNSRIQTYQILTNDEVCIPSLSSILIAVKRYHVFCFPFLVPLVHICSDSISPSFLRFVASKLAVQWVKIIYEEALIFLFRG